MRSARFLPVLLLGSLSLFLESCLGQYDPSRYYAQWKREWQVSIQGVPTLTASGEIPTAGANVVSADEHFATLCSSCHGAQGNGDGPGSVALNPKPRNFHDKAWQAKTDDARIIAVITNGGASVGLSAVMPPWGSSLSQEEILKMVQKIRAFGSK